MHLRLTICCILCGFCQPVNSAVLINRTFSVNTTIPDGGEFVDVQHVDAPSLYTAQIQVGLVFSAATEPGFNGDLYVTLSNADGGFGVLLNRVGKNTPFGLGYSDSSMNITLDDSAANGDIHVYRQQYVGDSIPLTVTLGGTWQPDGRYVNPNDVLTTDARTQTLNSFLGKGVGGNWTLFVADMSTGGANHLESWSLSITAVPELEHSATIISLLLLGFAVYRRYH